MFQATLGVHIQVQHCVVAQPTPPTRVSWSPSHNEMITNVHLFPAIRQSRRRRQEAEVPPQRCWPPWAVCPLQAGYRRRLRPLKWVYCLPFQYEPLVEQLSKGNNNKGAILLNNRGLIKKFSVLNNNTYITVA